MEDLGSYKIVISADYSNMISAMNAAMDAVVKKTESISKAIEAAAQNVDKSMKAMVASMQGVGSGGNGVDKMLSQYDALQQRMADTAKESERKYKSLQSQVAASAREADKAWQGGGGVSGAFSDAKQGFTEANAELNTFKSSLTGTYEKYIAGETKAHAAMENMDRARESMQTKAYERVAAQREKALAEEQKIRSAIDSLQQKSYSKYIADEGKLQSFVTERERSRELFQTKAYDNHTAQINRQSQQERTAIESLGKQYETTYRRVASYVDSNTKMSAQQFAKARSDMSAIESAMGARGASPAMKNPLSGFGNYQEYAAGFNNIDAAIKKATKSAGAFNKTLDKMKSHVEWMVSATVSSAIVLAPFAAVGSIAKIEQEMAGLKQVLPSVQNDQAKLNKTTMEFIGIAAQYGLHISEITESAKLWGRAYKDVNTIETLLHSSSILAVADSFSMTEANKALESTMMQFGMRARNAAEAMQFSMKIVDSWTNVAHNAIVSAQDLSAANERSASAAKQAGVSFDFLQGMIGTMSRNTGRAGAEVGNAIRSLLVSIHTDKAIKEIEKMGVSMYKVGEDGAKSFRDVESVMLDLMVVSDSTDKNIEKLMQSISGGKFQYNKVASLIGDYNELIRVTELSINSQGVAQHQAEMQIDTLSRKFQTLGDQLQAIAVGAGNSGLTQWLKDVVDGVNSILARVATMPSGNWQIIGMVIALSAGIGALNIILKAGTTGWIEYKTLIEATTVAKGKQAAANVIEAATQSAANAAGTKGAVVSGLSTAAKEAETVSTIQLTYAERALAVARGLATGGLTLLIGALVTGAIGYGLFNTESAESLKLAKDQATAEEKLTAQLKDKESSTVAEVDHLKSKIKFVNDLSSVYPKLLEIYKQEIADGKDGLKTKEKIETTEKALTSMLGSEAVERIKNSANVQKAMEDEITKLQEKQAKLAEVLMLERKAIIDHSEATIKKANERLDAIKAETLGLATEAQKQIAIYESINSAKLASLSGRAEHDQGAVEASTARLHDMLSRSGGKETDGTIIERTLQNDLVLQAGKSLAAKNAALKAEGAAEMAKAKQAVADIAAAVNPFTQGSGTGGTVGEKEEKGRKETAYMKAKGAYEAEAAKREADAAMNGYKYTLAEKLALFHQYLDDVEKLEDSKHHEQTDFKKNQYALQYGKTKEDIAKQRNELEIAIAKENISTRDAIMKRIEWAKLEVDNELIGGEEKVAKIKELAALEKSLADLEISVAQKKRELRQQEIKEKQALMNLDIEHAYSLGMITTPQKIAYQKQNAQDTYRSSTEDNQNLVGQTAKNNPTDYAAMIAAFRDYQTAVTHIERDSALQRAVLASGNEVKTIETLNRQAQAHAQYAETIKRLNIESYNETHRYQIAAFEGMKQGISSALNGIMEKTMSLGQAIGSIFKVLLKSIANTFSNDMAQRWTQSLSKMLFGTQRTTQQTSQLFAQSGQAQQQASYGAAAVVTQMQDALAQKFAQMCAMEITANAAKNAAKKASDAVAKAEAMVNIETMLAQLAIMLILSALMGGGSSESTSTASVSLGRNPESYYNVPSFDTGSWYVPNDMLARVHQGETIMPKTFAEDFRSALSGGGVTSGMGSVQVRQTNNVSTIDGRGMTKALMGSSDGVAKAFKKEVRRFNTAIK